MKPIEFVAKSFGIAPIRIHQLIRKGYIKFKANEHFVYVDEFEISKYMDHNPDIYTKWKDDYAKVQNSKCLIK